MDTAFGLPAVFALKSARADRFSSTIAVCWLIRSRVPVALTAEPAPLPADGRYPRIRPRPLHVYGVAQPGGRRWAGNGVGWGGSLPGRRVSSDNVRQRHQFIHLLTTLLVTTRACMSRLSSFEIASNVLIFFICFN